MDSIKEIFDAVSQRLKAPVLGYIFLAFTTYNWKALYYIAFSGEPVLERFEYFDTNTGWYSLYVIPIAMGILVAYISPRMSKWGASIAADPINERRLIEINKAHEVLQAKNELSAERDNQQKLHRKRLADSELDVIEKAKRDVEIEALPDEIKKEVKVKVDELRDSPRFYGGGKAAPISDEFVLTEFEALIITRAKESQKPFKLERLSVLENQLKFESSTLSADANTMRTALRKLMNGNFMREDLDVLAGPDYYVLTSAGRRAESGHDYIVSK